MKTLLKIMILTQLVVACGKDESTTPVPAPAGLTSPVFEAGVETVSITQDAAINSRVNE